VGDGAEDLLRSGGPQLDALQRAHQGDKRSVSGKGLIGKPFEKTDTRWERGPAGICFSVQKTGQKLYELPIYFSAVICDNKITNKRRILPKLLLKNLPHRRNMPC
jgi:hypothetical protein